MKIFISWNAYLYPGKKPEYHHQAPSTDNCIPLLWSLQEKDICMGQLAPVCWKLINCGPWNYLTDPFPKKKKEHW